jgi:GAF domain-containing protein
VEQLLRTLTRITLVDRPLKAVLGDIVRAAAAAIPGAESTSITLVQQDRAYTAAHHGGAALAAEETQYGRGYGPCMDAARGGVVIRIDDMRTEPRFGDYPQHAADQGVSSSLSVPLPYQGSSIGALNLYSSQPSAFVAPEVSEKALLVAEVLAIAVLNADRYARVSEEAQNLRQAMQSRAVIEQAKGILMERERLHPAGAFDRLRKAARARRRRVSEVAAEVVAGDPLPPPSNGNGSLPPS